jgi:hypothetical protein
MFTTRRPIFRAMALGLVGVALFVLVREAGRGIGVW